MDNDIFFRSFYWNSKSRIKHILFILNFAHGDMSFVDCGLLAWSQDDLAVQMIIFRL